MLALDIAFTLLALAVLAPACYLGLLTLLSARLPEPELPRGGTRFDIVVPAHNEELGIARTVNNLLMLEWPPKEFRVVVVADNCSDATADRAREAGATVLERKSADQKGKGYALELAFKQSLADKKADAVVVVDADTVVSKNLLAAFAARLQAGAVAVQAHYGVLEETSSWRTRLMRIAFAVFHGVRSLARERLGVSCGLRGNGMCFSRAVLKEVPHDAFSVVEDVEYGIRLAKKGHPVRYAHEAYVLGEMVANEKGSRSQRRRWEGGRLQLMREHGVPLLREGLIQRSPLLLDLAADLLVPPLSWLVAPAGLCLLASVWGSVFGGHRWVALWPSLLACALLGAYVLRGWALSGVGPRGLLDLAYAPVYVFWKLKLMLVPAEGKKGEWVRTQREAEAKKGASK